MLVRTHVGVQRTLYFVEVERLLRRLADIAAGQPEYLFEQVFVALDAAAAHAQVVLNGALHDRFHKLVSHAFPGLIGRLVGYWVATTLREKAEGLVSERV